MNTPKYTCRAYRLIAFFCVCVSILMIDACASKSELLREQAFNSNEFLELKEAYLNYLANSKNGLDSLRTMYEAEQIVFAEFVKGSRHLKKNRILHGKDVQTLSRAFDKKYPLQKLNISFEQFKSKLEEK